MLGLEKIIRTIDKTREKVIDVAADFESAWYEFKDKNSVMNKKDILKGLGILLGGAYVTTGCGGSSDGGGNTQINNGPDITANALPDGYEGVKTAAITMTDDDGIDYAVLSYDGPSTDVANFTNVGGDDFEATADLPSGHYTGEIIAYDLLGNETTIPVSFSVNANEVHGDGKLDESLNAKKTAGDITDYMINTTFDLDGMLIEVDAAAYKDGKWSVIEYNGEGGNISSAEITKLGEYGITVSTINPCVADNIAGIVDNIVADDFIGGSY